MDYYHARHGLAILDRVHPPDILDEKVQQWRQTGTAAEPYFAGNDYVPLIERPRLRRIWNLNRYAVCAKTLGCIFLVETQQPGIKVAVHGDRLPVD